MKCKFFKNLTVKDNFYKRQIFNNCMIEYILFDLSEVWIQGMVGAEKEIAKRVGATEEQVWKHLNVDALMPLFEGKISEDEYWRSVAAEGSKSGADYFVPLDFFKETMRSNFTELPGTRTVIVQLKEQECDEDVEAKYPIRDLFDQVNWSFEIGYTKRSAKSFEYAMRRSGADPSKILFVDDNPKNLRVATAACIQYTHHFIDAPTLEAALQDLGVLVHSS